MSDPVKSLFEQALELPPEARSGFVAERCGPDPRLRERLLALLRAHEEAGDFLEHPTGLVAAAADDLDATAPGRGDDEFQPGSVIGNHVLLECIGSGGFGRVFRARQREPVERDVALKILHAGLDTGLVLARFLAERQTLARMQHPAIAKVFDAGATPSGRPWFAMELVAGRPITEHCAAQALPLPARLSLFAEVCLAVQHAHDKGVVHRDLKPANILVAMRDGRPQPMIIDFGVAAALDPTTAAHDGEPAGEDGHGALLGTPDYMSPEQAAFDRGAVDTRSDVYSLGVVLYELVCGERPFARAAGPAGQLDLLRRIRAGIVVPPSQRAPRAARRLRELDAVVLQAMALQPAQRYPTAAALAEDIGRFLRHEPLVAGPGTAWYRASKFARRHRAVVALAALLFLSLGIGTFVAVQGWMAAHAAAVVARQEQRAAERESQRANRTLDLLDGLWQAADPGRLGHTDYPVRELLADFERALPRALADEPDVELRLRRTLGSLQRSLGSLAAAELHGDRAVELARASGSSRELAAALLVQARTRFDQGAVAVAEQAVTEAVALLRAAAPPDAAALAEALEVQANCRLRRGDAATALQCATEALRHREELPVPAGPVARSLLQLANLHGSAGRADVAMEHLQRALGTLAELDHDHPDRLVGQQHLALLQQRLGQHDAAEASFRATLAGRTRVYGEDHALVAWAMVDLAWLLHERGRDGEAVGLLRRATPVLRARLGERHLYVSEAMQRLGSSLIGVGELDEAGALLQEAVERYRTLPGHPADGLVGCLGNLASLKWRHGERAAAAAIQADALAIAEQQLPVDHFVLSVSMTNLAYMLAELEQPQRAAELLQSALERSTAAGRAGEARIQRERLAALLDRLGDPAAAAALREQRR